jgi:hypothetical protein
MPSLAKPPRTSQLTLFHPPATTPRWESLPAEVQRQTLALLVRLLCAVCEPRATNHARSRSERPTSVGSRYFPWRCYWRLRP